MNNLRKRKNLRLKDYNYSHTGLYFITICIKDKHELLGNFIAGDAIVAGDTIVGDAVLSVPQKNDTDKNAVPQKNDTGKNDTDNTPILILSDIGQIVKTYLDKMNDVKSFVSLQKYVIMPNHIHLLILIKYDWKDNKGSDNGNGDDSIDKNNGDGDRNNVDKNNGDGDKNNVDKNNGDGDKNNVDKNNGDGDKNNVDKNNGDGDKNNVDKNNGTLRTAPPTTASPTTASPTTAVIPQIVHGLKAVTTKQIGFSIWQRSYHDHIIRNEQEYQKIWQYIDENPLKWKGDCYYNNP